MKDLFADFQISEEKQQALNEFRKFIDGAMDRGGKETELHYYGMPHITFAACWIVALCLVLRDDPDYNEKSRQVNSIARVLAEDYLNRHGLLYDTESE